MRTTCWAKDCRALCRRNYISEPSRGPLGPAEARRLAERRGAARSEPPGPQGRPEIANASSEACSCRDQSAKTQDGAGVLQRNGSNRAEKISQGAAKAGKSIVQRILNSGSRCKSPAGIAGIVQPTRPGCGKRVSARIRWNLFGACRVVQ
jgi:hypothetical protein